MAEQGDLLRRPLAWGRSLRPQQWIKNGLVFLPLLFAVGVVWSPGDLAQLPDLLITLGVVFLAFCAVSSGVYLINDLSDRASDRNHPLKRRRPIASGAVAVPVALASVVVLIGGGLAALALSDLVLLWIGLVYVGINLAYSLGAKNVVLVDVLAVASGYVIRVALGALAIGVVPSPWLYATTAAGALFIVLGRRYAELRLAGRETLPQGATPQRPGLSSYSGPFIGQLLTISATAAWLSYTLYTVEAQPAGKRRHAADGAFGYRRIVPVSLPPEHQRRRGIPGALDHQRPAHDPVHRDLDCRVRRGSFVGRVTENLIKIRKDSRR